jgi:hypothetical protein
MKRYLAAALVLGCLVLSLQTTPGADKDPPLKPVNLEQLNTKADEDDPFVAADGLTLYYASNAAGSFDLMVSQRSSGARGWPAGRPLPDLNTKDADERSPFLTRDGKFFFATNATPKGPEKDVVKNFDLFQRRGQAAPFPLLAEGLNTEADELHPWVTTAGKEFYFSRKTKEGWRLFVSPGPTPGPIGEPKQVDLPAGFHHATLSRDGFTMYVQGPLGKDRWGLFRTARAKVGGPWAKPEPLSDLNSPDALRGDMSPCLSPDGSRLYFASDRPGGKGGLDLWYVATKDLKRKTK